MLKIPRLIGETDTSLFADNHLKEDYTIRLTQSGRIADGALLVSVMFIISTSMIDPDSRRSPGEINVDNRNGNAMIVTEYIPLWVPKYLGAVRNEPAGRPYGTQRV